MFVIAIDDLEPRILPLNTSREFALSQFGQYCIRYSDATHIMLIEIGILHCKPVLNKTLAAYDKEGLANG